MTLVLYLGSSLMYTASIDSAFPQQGHRKMLVFLARDLLPIFSRSLCVRSCIAFLNTLTMNSDIVELRINLLLQTDMG